MLHARSSPAERAARLEFAQGGKGSKGHYPLFLEFGHPHFKALDAAQASPRVRPGACFPGCDALAIIAQPCTSSRAGFRSVIVT